jgi:hypothetical protein
LGALVGCSWVVQRTIASGVYTDFAMLYQSAVALERGTDLYVQGDAFREGNLNPPHVVLVMRPLAEISLEQAALVGWLVIGVSMLATAFLVRRALPRWWVVAALAVALASPAGYLSVRLINLSWPLAVGITWAWLAMRKGHSGRAGAILGVLATVKLFLLLFVPYLVWRRQWKALTAGLAAGTAAVALGALMVGQESYRGWVGQLRSVEWQGNPINVSLLGAFQRNLDPSARGGLTAVADASYLVRPLWLGTAVLMLAIMWWRFRNSRQVDSEWASVLIAALLISPLGWSYYWALVIGPLAATAAARPFSALAFAGTVLCLTPFFLLTSGQPSPVLTATLATSYTWGGVMLWGWTCARPTSSST